MRKNESRLDAFNIVGGSPIGTLCMSIADPERAAGAQLSVAACDGGDQQWFRLLPWPEQAPAF